MKPRYVYVLTTKAPAHQQRETTNQFPVKIKHVDFERLNKRRDKVYL